MNVLEFTASKVEEIWIFRGFFYAIQAWPGVEICQSKEEKSQWCFLGWEAPSVPNLMVIPGLEMGEKKTPQLPLSWAPPKIN